MTGRNPYERAGRAEKVNALVFAINDAFDRGNIKAAGDRLYAVEHMTPAQWAAAERDAKLLHEASDETRAQVVAVYRLNAQCAAEIERAAKTPMDRALENILLHVVAGGGSTVGRRVSQAELTAVVEQMKTAPENLAPWAGNGRRADDVNPPRFSEFGWRQ